jgi:hypothetical protein
LVDALRDCEAKNVDDLAFIYGSSQLLKSIQSTVSLLEYLKFVEARNKTTRIAPTLFSRGISWLKSFLNNDRLVTENKEPPVWLSLLCTDALKCDSSGRSSLDSTHATLLDLAASKQKYYKIVSDKGELIPFSEDCPRILTRDIYEKFSSDIFSYMEWRKVNNLKKVRDWNAEHKDKLSNSPPSSYVYLEGKAGIGKTVFLLWFICDVFFRARETGRRAPRIIYVQKDGAKWYLEMDKKPVPLASSQNRVCEYYLSDNMDIKISGVDYNIKLLLRASSDGEGTEFFKRTLEAGSSLPLHMLDFSLLECLRLFVHGRKMKEGRLSLSDRDFSFLYLSSFYLHFRRFAISFRCSRG